MSKEKTTTTKQPKTIMVSTILPWLIVVALTAAILGTALGWFWASGVDSAQDTAVHNAVSQLKVQ